jgi:hypothetical protein
LSLRNFAHISFEEMHPNIFMQIPSRQQLNYPSVDKVLSMRGPSPDLSISIRHDLQPGDVGYITYMHGTLYAKEMGWDHTFDAYVAAPLSEFARSQSSWERIWIIEKDGKIVGSAAIVKFSEEEAQIRWLLLDPSIRGRGNRTKTCRRGSGFLPRGRILVGVSFDGEYTYSC